MTPREVLALCRERAAAGAFTVATSAAPEVSPSDVRHVLGSASRCDRHPARGWTITGSTLDGEVVTLYVLIGPTTLTVLTAPGG